MALGKIVQLLWKRVWQCLKKLNRALLHELAISVLGTHSQWLKLGFQIHMRACTFTTALLTKAKRWKKPKGLFVDERTKQL